MKNFEKALKLYLKATFNPIAAAFGIFIMAALFVGVSVSPESPESDDYMSMIATVGFGQIGILISFVMGGVSTARYRCYASLPFAKTFFTIVPTVCTAAAAFIYDIIAITIVAVYCGEQALSDILIIAPVNSFIICLAAAFIGKPKLEPMYLIPMLIMATESIVLPRVSFTAHGFGLPVPVSAVVGVLIFIAGVALALLIMSIWWRKCDHIYRGNYNSALNRI